MIVTILILEDVESWAIDLKNNLEALGSEFFDTIPTKITKIRSIVATNTGKALEIIESKCVDLISIDIRLTGDDAGHEFYEQLFVKGHNLPSIVVSGEVKTPQIEKEIFDKGIPIIVRKLTGDPEEVYIQVAKAICEVLDSPKKSLTQLVTYVKHFMIGGVTIEYNDASRTIDGWLEIIVSNKLSESNSKNIKKLISDECLKQSYFDEHSLYD